MRNRISSFRLLLCSVSIILTSCGGSSSSSSSAAGIALPAEISGLPATEDAVASATLLPPGTTGSPVTIDLGHGELGQFVANLDLGSASQFGASADINQLETKVAAFDPSVQKVFSFIEMLCNTISQTLYYETGLVGASEASAVPYQALLIWEEEQMGQMMKQIQLWTVKSFLDGSGRNHVQVWVPGGGGKIGAEFVITQAATKDENNIYTDYGIWYCRATDELGNMSFYCSAGILEDGSIRLEIQETDLREYEGTPYPYHTKGILVRGVDGTGYAKFEYTDEEECYNSDVCQGLTGSQIASEILVAGTMAYNENYVFVTINGSLTKRDLADPHLIVEQYGLFNADGDRIDDQMNFGFPVVAQEDSDAHYYYTAIDGLPHLFGGGPGGGSLADGTVMVREGLASGDGAPEYTTESWDGGLFFLTKTTTNLEEIQDMPLQSFVSFFQRLKFSGGSWKLCLEPDCSALEVVAYDMDSLVMIGNNDPKFVTIMQGGDNYVFDGTDLLVAEMGEGRWESVSPPQTYTPDPDDEIEVQIFGTEFLKFDSIAEDWKRMELEYFDQQNFNPVFSGTTSAVAWPLGQERIFNRQGSEYKVVKVDDSGTPEDDYVVARIVKTGVGPSNEDSLVPDGTVFVDRFNADGSSTYVYDKTDHRLEFQTVAGPDAGMFSVGQAVPNGLYDLTFEADDTQAVQWFPSGDFQGMIVWLKDSNDEYVEFDERIDFDAVPVPNLVQVHDGDPENEWTEESPVYDGSLRLAFNAMKALEVNGWSTVGVLNKAKNLFDWQKLTANGEDYYVRWLVATIFYGSVSATPLTTPDAQQALADAINFSTDLTTLPAAEVDPGAAPSGLLKVNAGVLIE